MREGQRTLRLPYRQLFKNTQRPCLHTYPGVRDIAGKRLVRKDNKVTQRHRSGDLRLQHFSLKKSAKPFNRCNQRFRQPTNLVHPIILWILIQTKNTSPWLGSWDTIQFCLNCDGFDWMNTIQSGWGFRKPNCQYARKDQRNPGIIASPEVSRCLFFSRRSIRTRKPRGDILIRSKGGLYLPSRFSISICWWRIRIISISFFFLLIL